MKKFLILTALLGAFTFMPQEAKAYGRDCRDYTRTVTLNGFRYQAYGTACFQPNGAWEITQMSGAPIAQEALLDMIQDDARRYYGRNVSYVTRDNYYYGRDRHYDRKHYKKHKDRDRWDDDRRGWNNGPSYHHGSHNNPWAYNNDRSGFTIIYRD